ncbi:MAG: hypothetical protein RLZZ15_401 [Verrucomicrobiota bacterium]
MQKKSSPSRREFLGSACCAAVGLTGMVSTLAALRATAAAASIPSGSATPARGAAVASDYKALVCILLNGGNDSSNLIIPNDTSGYADYVKARTILALPQSNLLSITPKTSDGRAFALHPSTTELRSLFNSGKLALMANVGTLVYPTTKAQYSGNLVPLPPQLFSHSDQQVQWQSSIPDQPFRTGWGGRTADLLNSLNTNPQVSMSMSLDGFNNFQVGSTLSQLAVQRSSGTGSKGGPIALTGATGNTTATTRSQAQKDLLAASQANLFSAAFGTLTADALADSDLLSAALAASPNLTTTFPVTTLANQLKTIAYLISISSSLNLKRQVFFARLGGWDTHADQVDGTGTGSITGAHADLLGQLSQAMNAFYNATVELGVANQVTTFTASDFGRTFTSNGDGSDHGWGGHQMVLGGAVKGGDIYGKMPSPTVGGPDDTGLGRWIPTTSVDEYNATLARWFGVSETNLAGIFPNLGRFAKPNLGFL